jgi:molecular chaperone HscA
LREQQVEADRLLEALHTALAKDADLLSNTERVAIDALSEQLIEIKALNNPDRICDAIKALSDATAQFAANRMNKGIVQALKGKHLNQV